MAHKLYRARIILHTAFGTPLAGDTLFGQICWAAHEYRGDNWLTELLQGYIEGRPWLVVSDAFPAGYLPRPTLPQRLTAPTRSDRADSAALRKTEKGKVWIPANVTALPLAEMLSRAVDNKSAFGLNCIPKTVPQSHNSLSRLSGTTEGADFSPYTMSQTFYASGQRMEIYLAADDERIDGTSLQKLLSAIGHQGFGRDASIGLGKFTVEKLEPHTWPANLEQEGGDGVAWLTLAPCAPQGLELDAARSYWRVVTRFGRHGNRHALSGNAFKNPLLLAQTGAVFTSRNACHEVTFLGQGLGGVRQPVSVSSPATVSQGYAPVVAIRMEAA